MRLLGCICHSGPSVAILPPLLSYSSTPCASSSASFSSHQQHRHHDHHHHHYVYEQHHHLRFLISDSRDGSRTPEITRLRDQHCEIICLLHSPCSLSSSRDRTETEKASKCEACEIIPLVHLLWPQTCWAAHLTRSASTIHGAARVETTVRDGRPSYESVSVLAETCQPFARPAQPLSRV